MRNSRLIESDNFDFEFLSQLAERESWRKEIHRPIYHLHKWWAKRLGSVFRGILLASLLPEDAELADEFYSQHDFKGIKVFDPFMGSGTTIGEAHKLGLTALGRDINPVAAETVRVAFGPMHRIRLDEEFSRLSLTVGRKILQLYRSTDSFGAECDVLYYFWVMQAPCPKCDDAVDLFPSWTIARNAYPDRKPETQVLCPDCGAIFPSTNASKIVSCPTCSLEFDPDIGNANGAKAQCAKCRNSFSILAALDSSRPPRFRLYGKLVMTEGGTKQYLKVTSDDLRAAERCSTQLAEELRAGTITLPDAALTDGYNTKQAISYGFNAWQDFFNDRQLLGLGWLRAAIAEIPDETTRDVLLQLFSGLLEFNNMFASYKGEGTGAVRHMFSHHILKPERIPIEANIWGTPKSSGSFLNLYRNRLSRALAYRREPTEVNGTASAKGRVCSPAFTGIVNLDWPKRHVDSSRQIYLSCGDSSSTELPDKSIALVVTDPPFFDNVHYSELADFFYSWQKLAPNRHFTNSATTRSPQEVQDADAECFTEKLQGVFGECHRILQDDGLLVFTYHHSRDEGWQSVAAAVLQSGFVVVNAHPVKSEMSVATPKSQANEPIQLDMVIVCRKAASVDEAFIKPTTALAAAEEKIRRLENAGLALSKNDRKIIALGQLLVCVHEAPDAEHLPAWIEGSKVA